MSDSVIECVGSEGVRDGFFSEVLRPANRSWYQQKKVEEVFCKDKRSSYGFWMRPHILIDIVKKYNDGIVGNDLIDYINQKYGVNYEYSSYSIIMNHKVFKDKVNEYQSKLNDRVTREVIEFESKEIAKTIINSKDVLRSAIFKMGSLLNKVDETDETDDELVKNRKLKYGDYPRLMKELRETIKLLNELEGTGETITIEDIMAKFKRNKEGELINANDTKEE